MEIERHQTYRVRIAVRSGPGWSRKPVDCPSDGTELVLTAQWAIDDGRYKGEWAMGGKALDPWKLTWIASGDVVALERLELVPPMEFYWLSFCATDKPEGAQFLGACIVGPCLNFPEALRLAWIKRCNPGGECEGLGIPWEHGVRIHEKWRDRLLSREECEAFDQEDPFAGEVARGPVRLP